MNRPSQTQIDAAVTWWAARLVSCKQSGLSAEERADPANRAYEFGEMLMTLNRPKITPTQIDTFAESLRTRLAVADPWTARTLGVDYGPDPILADALTDAGIPDHTGMLPIKTVMWLRDDGSVAVRYGYAAPIETIYADPPAGGEQEGT